jgi:hypothetical protein
VSPPEAITLADAIARLVQASAGSPFPENAVELVGGWDRIAREAGALEGEAALPLLAQLAARDAGNGPDERASAALLAVADAIMATPQPALLRDSLAALLGAEGATRVTGDRLATGLPAVVETFFSVAGRPPVADLAAADALEVLTTLTVAGYGSHFRLLALLERFDAPAVLPMARAAIRSINTAVDVWPEADSLADRVRILGGLDPVDGADADIAAAAESDATWALGMIAVLRALRARSVTDMVPHLDDAHRLLDAAATTHDRRDAVVMRKVIEALRELVVAIVEGKPVKALESEALSPTALDELRAQVLSFCVDTSGLDHWYGDRKQAVLAAWAGVVDDLDRLRVEFTKNAFYQAEVIVGDLLHVYLRSRSFTIHPREPGVIGVQNLVQPVVEGGFASKASHLSNLEQHAAMLEARVAKDPDTGLEDQLDAARQIIEVARRAAKGDESSGKVESGASLAPLPASLSEFIESGSADEAVIRQISPDTLAALAAGLEHVDFGRQHLNIVQREVFDEIRTALAGCPDYKGEVVPVVDEVLRLVLNFVVSRTAAESGHYAYLFDESAVESHIHEDMYNYLVGNLGARAEYEVSHVGGGRVDLRLKFDGFAIHIEMKVDSTQVPMSDKTAYLKQAATYQGNDIRIGFLVALRHKAFPKGPPPHLKALMGHTKFDIPGDLEARHIVTVAVPGSRTKPSDSTAR